MWVPLLLVLCAIALLINLCPYRKCFNLFNFCSDVFENSKKPIYEAFKFLHVCAYCISFKMLNATSKATTEKLNMTIVERANHRLLTNLFIFLCKKLECLPS